MDAKTSNKIALSQVRERLSAGNEAIFLKASEKFSIWASDPRAYYPVVFEDIIHTLLCACQVLMHRYVPQKSSKQAIQDDLHILYQHIDSDPMVHSYCQMVETVAGFLGKFPQQLHKHIYFCLQTLTSSQESLTSAPLKNQKLFTDLIYNPDATESSPHPTCETLSSTSPLSVSPIDTVISLDQKPLSSTAIEHPPMKKHPRKAKKDISDLVDLDLPRRKLTVTIPSAQISGASSGDSVQGTGSSSIADSSMEILMMKTYIRGDTEETFDTTISSVGTSMAPPQSPSAAADWKEDAVIPLETQSTTAADTRETRIAQSTGGREDELASRMVNFATELNVNGTSPTVDISHWVRMIQFSEINLPPAEGFSYGSVVNAVRGISGSRKILVSITLLQSQLFSMNVWCERLTTDKPIEKSLCFSLARYPYEGNESIPPPKSKASDLNSRESIWPQDMSLNLEVPYKNYRISIPLSPPIEKAIDGLVDISKFLTLGKNELCIEGTSDMDNDIFVVVAHYPTRAFLEELIERREKICAYESFKEKIASEPLWDPAVPGLFSTLALI